MMEDMKLITGSATPEPCKSALFQSLCCGSTMNTGISPEYTSWFHVETCRVSSGDGLSNTMIDPRVRTSGHTSMTSSLPGCEDTVSIPASCVLIAPGAGLLDTMSYPGISGPGIQKFKYSNPDELISFQERPGDYTPADR
jgi:hypothetical protein